MDIITWNANRVNRWDLLWADARVAAGQWDVICLQEAGNPDPNWTPAQGPVWQPQAGQRRTIEPIVCRRYTYQPPGYGGATLHIWHGEWPNRQKNHLAVITRNPSSWVADISGQMGERPAIAIKVRLNWSHGLAPTDVLVGTVHIIANRSKAPQEVSEMLPFVDAMCAHAGVAGWILAGDFNCDPTTMINSVPVGALWPNFPTHQNTAQPIDYVLMQPALYGTFLAVPGIAGNWAQGTTAVSDHLLVEYAPANGPAMQIL